MAIGTYSELQTAVANWLDRSDLTARIPEFIALAESMINKDAAQRDGLTPMIQRAVSSISTEYVDLPSDYYGMRNIRLNTTPKRHLEYMPISLLDSIYGSDETGEPKMYTVVGTQVRVLPVPDGVYEMEISYIQKLPALTDSNTTNWLLTDSPDLYLYATLMQAEPYLVNDERVNTWGAAYQAGMDRLRGADSGKRYSGSSLKIRSRYKGF